MRHVLRVGTERPFCCISNAINVTQCITVARSRIIMENGHGKVVEKSLKRPGKVMEK